MLKEIYKTEDHTDKIDFIDKKILGLANPKIYGGHKGAEAITVNNFVDTCLIIEANGLSSNARQMTVISFLRAVEMLKEQNKKIKKS
jgi:hypothetical protein